MIGTLTMLQFICANDNLSDQGYKYLRPAKEIPPSHLVHPTELRKILVNPLLATLLLSATLGIPPEGVKSKNHSDYGSINPYIAVLLSQYGRYLPGHVLDKKGLYYYAAANNYHNNMPFGTYKVNENT
ncbi:hypothetical protein ABEB36_003779 [Hypothenemus hampei]|uniref:Uncharacterized protein n=1 Tax=Hypothenemus hampei TaxID=57062 RepID=A0ABD1F155_HYPHA